MEEKEEEDEKGREGREIGEGAGRKEEYSGTRSKLGLVWQVSLFPLPFLLSFPSLPFPLSPPLPFPA